MVIDSRSKRCPRNQAAAPPLCPRRKSSITLDNVRSYKTLEKERQLLDKIVDERTRELSEALDATHEAVRLKAEFLAKVLHELRTPLNSIVNIPSALANDYAEVDVYRCDGCGADFQSDDDESDTPCPECGESLSKHQTTFCAGDPAEHLRFLELLEKQGAHLLSLGEEVLDFSKLGSGSVELNYTTIDIGERVFEIQQTRSISEMSFTQSGSPLSPRSKPGHGQVVVVESMTSRRISRWRESSSSEKGMRLPWSPSPRTQWTSLPRNIPALSCSIS
jgi:signal transduction histidine kinase